MSQDVWLPNPPDLNPMDFPVWFLLERALIHVLDEITMEIFVNGSVNILKPKDSILTFVINVIILFL